MKIISIFLTTLIFIAWNIYVSAQTEVDSNKIRVPYGFIWGQSFDDLQGILKSVQVKKFQYRRTDSKTELLEVYDLPSGNLLITKTIFNFHEKLLAEIEQQFSDINWQNKNEEGHLEALNFFEKIRQNFDQRYGQGYLLVKKIHEPFENKNHLLNKKSLHESTTYTLIIYEWVQSETKLELSFYSATDNQKAVRIISIHHRAT